jgi:nucleotide-binding universal stress UspA family protein
MSAGTPTRIHRILLALDATCGDADCLLIAVELAARLEAELVGLFVEDENLIRLAGLPFVRSVSPLTATPTSLTLDITERELKSFASRAERHLAGAAEQRRVKWTFRVVRGQVAREIAAASEDHDLVAVAETAPRALTHSSVGRTIRHAVSGAGRPLLLLRPGVKTEGPIVVIYDGTQAAAEALDIALQLLVGIDAALEVFLAGETVERARDLTQALRERSAGRTTIRIHRFPTVDFALLRRALNGMNAGLLLLAAESPVLAGRSVDEVMRSVPCPVMLLR